MKLIWPLFIVLFLAPSWEAKAEPWLSNRYAQNCSACHAPGRINRKPKDRRCTLSCQGCHVNPNGGGLRNHYGMWNSQRFLRSFYSELTWNKKLPAKFAQQKYASPKIESKLQKSFALKGAPLVTREGAGYAEQDYQDHSNYKRTAQNMVEDLMYITSNDPYRLERSQSIYATGDFRLFYANLVREVTSQPSVDQGWVLWPMALDVGIRLRPFQSHKFSFVYETRAFTTPTGDSVISFDRLFGSSNVLTRSAYLLYDDLPYNSYIQAGFYRPLFGIYDPNHRTLMADYTELDQYAVFKAIGFGMAPNVPFFIFNILDNSDNPQPISAQEKGFAVTAGLRGVTKGWSLVTSYWSTRAQTLAGAEFRKLMVNVNGGLQLGRFTLNADVIRVDRTAINGQRDAATVLTAQTKARFWRENYFLVNYSQANAAIDNTEVTLFSPGTGGELAIGVKAFTIAGLEIETLVQNKENKLEMGNTTKETATTVQLHFFF